MPSLYYYLDGYRPFFGLSVQLKNSLYLELGKQYNLACSSRIRRRGGGCFTDEGDLAKHVRVKKCIGCIICMYPRSLIVCS